MPISKKPRCFSLFAGAGGCSLGFKRAGYRILLALDHDRSSCNTYAKNFHHTDVRQEDVTLTNWSQLLVDHQIKQGELDILIGGPPCQGFSTAWEAFLGRST